MPLVFNVEPADTSVGIMTEQISAWMSGDTHWCELADFDGDKCVFSWYNVDGDLVPTDKVGTIRRGKEVERYLAAFVREFYAEPEEPCSSSTI